VPLSAENDASADFFLPEFIHRFFPDRQSLQLLLDTRFFSRVRRLSLAYAHSLALQQDQLTWNGFRVCAIDGTKKNLPASDELSDFFGAPHHAHFPQMITGVLFDVLAKLPRNYMRAPFNTPERDMAVELLQELGPGDLLLLDRGYPGYRMCHAAITQGTGFLVRLPKDGLFQAARAFLARGKRDGKITIFPPEKLLREHPNATYPPLTLRMAVVSLSGTAPDALFITTLQDSKKYPRRALRNSITTAGLKKNCNRSVALLKGATFFEIFRKKLHKGLVIL
jgi:hypothetical protein